MGTGNRASRLRHPMKGPMTTQTLRGLNGQDPLHWARRPDELPGISTALSSPDWADPFSRTRTWRIPGFINTIVFQPNPHQNLDRTLPASLEAATLPLAALSFRRRWFVEHCNLRHFTRLACRRKRSKESLPRWVCSNRRR